MQDLAGGMHPGICSTGDYHRCGRFGTGWLLDQGVFEYALDGATTRLLRPAREVRAVVGNIEPETDQGAFSPRKAPRQTNEPAIPRGSSGLVRYGFRRQDSSSDDSAASSSAASSSAFARCDGGSWKPAFSAASSLSNQTSATVCS